MHQLAQCKIIDLLSLISSYGEMPIAIAYCLICIKAVQSKNKKEQYHEYVSKYHYEVWGLKARQNWVYGKYNCMCRQKVTKKNNLSGNWSRHLRKYPQ